MAQPGSKSKPRKTRRGRAATKSFNAEGTETAENFLRMTFLCALYSENRTNYGADQRVYFCAALSGLEISGPQPRACALGSAVPPFQGYAFHDCENPERLSISRPRKPRRGGAAKPRA